MEDQGWDLEFQSLEDDRRTDKESEWYNVMAQEGRNCFLNVKEQVGPRLPRDLG